MTTWLPLPGATPRFCSRFVDDALGFAVGWNQWYNCAITVCAEISAAAVVIQFWNNSISVRIHFFKSLSIRSWQLSKTDVFRFSPPFGFPSSSS
jgi:amino acid permease